MTRRKSIEVAVATVGLGVTYLGTRERSPTDYGLWGILPVGTYKSKPTVQETIVADTIWTFDQKFGILNVQVPLRMTVVRLPEGLLVYNPIAATPQCVDMVRALEQRYGLVVKDIVVGSVALEHKVYAGVFAQKFPQARVWLTPGQYSFPVNLPDVYLGFPPGRTQTLDITASQLPESWRNVIDVATLGPIISRDGAFAETVLLHKPTKTLLVTDTCVVCSDQVPPIYDTDPAPLLYHARDTITDRVADTPATRRKGWKRIVLFGLYFNPSSIVIKDINTALTERRPDINSDFLGIYPWDWVGDEEASWRGLAGTNNNKPLVAPILQVLLLNRSPVEVLEFADTVAAWDIQRIIPAHLQNNLALTGRDYRASFGFLEAKGVPFGYPVPLPADLQLLRDAEQSLIASGAIVAAPPKVGGSASRREILDQTVYRCRAGTCAPRARVDE
jgi:hypothetical protein